jgi:hypothetical protein
MIQKRIPFIVPYKQMYIPQMFVSLTDMKSVQTQYRDKFSPAAQCLVLYHLQVSNLENVTFKDIAGTLKGSYSTMTISRIANELQKNDFCLIEGTKEKKIVFKHKGLELWTAIEKYLSTPIRKKVFVDDDFIPGGLKKTGISALSEYGNIAENQKTEYAIYFKDYKKISDKKIIKSSNLYEGDIPIEVWKYDPMLLSNNNYVDRLSLYLSLKNIEDPRIEIEIEELIKGMEW